MEEIEIEIEETRPLCIGCNKHPDEIPEYADMVWESSPDDFVREEEGTYNPENEHFFCTECYIKAGMPTGPNGWMAP